MKMIKKKLSAVVLVLVLALSLSLSAFAATSANTLSNAITDTAKYLVETVKAPQVGSIGGEWAVLGLARSGYAVPKNYYQNYYAAVEDYVRDCKGVLHEKKYTEYSRVIVALSAIGKDARNVAGYDLTKALGDYDKTIWQGINGPIWALIALDSAEYPMPKNPAAKTQATRQMYVDRILEQQLSDGGWSFGGSGAADPDITGMALQALAKYQDQKKVKDATEQALACMSAMQGKNGGFSSWGTENSESCVQILVALSELGISTDDPRFVKDGNTLLDNLMTYYTAGKGFNHTADGSGSNQMACEQAFYGLVAAQRLAEGKNSLYRMGDALGLGTASAPNAKEQPVKNAAVKPMPITNPGKTFEDISGANAHQNQAAIEAMAARGIINGKTNTTFDPNAKMTRAEFAAIVVRGLGLTPKANRVFKDVPASAWYAAYVGTAYDTGIVNGVSADKFAPNGTITRQEAATMVARAAKLCGIDTNLRAADVRSVLAQFGDYTKTAEWARQGLAVCYREDILDQSDLEILPQQHILRCEVAQMLYNLLAKAKLL